MHRNQAWIRRALIVAGVLAAVPIQGVAAADTSGWLEISSNTTLTGDHHGHIVIVADDVTLDCAGHLITGTGDWFVILIDGRSGVTVQNCRVTGGENGIVLVNATGQNLLAGNSSFSNVWQGFHVGSTASASLTGNEANGNGLGFGIYSSTWITVRGNSASYNGHGGFYAYASADSMFELNRANANASFGFGLEEGSVHNVVVGNSADGNGHIGYLLGHAAENTVRENVVTGSGTGFALRDADANTFVSNDVRANGHGFDVFRSSSNTFRQNVVMGSSDHGFKIHDGTDHNMFDENQVRGSGMAGFLMYGGYDFNQDYQLEPPDHNTFSANRVVGNGEGGISLGWDATENIVTGNIVRANAGSGIRLDRAAGNTISDNVSSANESTGIELDSSHSNNVRRNVVEDNPWAGLRVVSSNVNTFTGNMVRRNGTGLDMHESSENVFTNNRFFNSGPEGWGVWVADSSNDNRFEGNVAQGNDYEGFAVAFGSSGNTLVRNVSRGSNYEGISLYFGADHNVVRDNTVVENRTSGVLVYESSYNVITGNQAFRNNLGLFEGSAGISLVEGSSDNEISMNVACANGLADAYEDHSGTGNVWTGNKFCTSDI